MKYKAGDRVLVIDRETLENRFSHDGENIIIYDNVRYFIITPTMRSRCCGEVVEIIKDYFHTGENSYYELDNGYVLPEKMIVGKVDGKTIISLLNNEPVKDINEFCNKFCIMECDETCPLYNFKIRKENEREITKNFLKKVKESS